MKTAFSRVPSIDVFRAFTMFLMIFVNDLWTLTGIPSWMEHTATQTDGMGLADIVFPAFLVVMGMSIPFAIQNRIDNGQSKLQISWHIVIRSLALLIMGVFTVNFSELNGQATGINPYWYEIIAVAAFFMIWNVYPKAEGNRKYFYISIQITGVIILALLAIIFRGNAEGVETVTYFQPRWWGILGLIGWAYLGSALLYLLLKQSWIMLIAAWLFFMLFNIAGHSGIFGKGEVFVGNGAFHAFTFVGILLTLLLKRFVGTEGTKKFFSAAIAASVLLIIAGFLLRNFFIISKNLATPPWILICSGISIALFLIFYWLVDLKAKEKWFSIIKTGGTSTLTCYLIPYFVYSFYALYAFTLPTWLTTGSVGILKSVIFSLLIIGFTTVLGKLKIKLKI